MSLAAKENKDQLEMDTLLKAQRSESRAVNPGQGAGSMQLGAVSRNRGGDSALRHRLAACRQRPVWACRSKPRERNYTVL